MNIGEKHYCSKCFYSLPEETVCPNCGNDPEKQIPAVFLEEGTLLDHGRYQIGVPITFDRDTCYYGAWDYRSNAPVVVKEFLPRSILSRNVTISDEISIQDGAVQQYTKDMVQFLKNTPQDNVTNNRIIYHGVGYLIIKEKPMVFFRKI